MPDNTATTQPPNPDASSVPIVVLVHGAWHDARSWDLVVPILNDLGMATRTLTLPSIDPGPDRVDLADDIAAVNTLLDGIEAPVVLVGHSYGGMVISAAGHHRTVRHLVYLAAFCPDEGEAVLDLAVGEPPPLTATALRFHDNGTMTIDPTFAVDTFYADVARPEAVRRASELKPTSAAVFTAVSSAPAWKTKPVTSVICTNDRAISLDRVEQMAERANGQIIRWATSHSPFVSQPQLVADLLRSIASTL